MAKNEIVEKLNDFFIKHNPVSEECHVVYIMEQIRKLLEHERDHWRDGSFTLLHFYCDWTMHTEKDVITENIKVMMDEIFQDAKKQIETPFLVQAKSSVIKFAYMERLRDEMRRYLDEHSINTSITEEDKWVSFVGFLVKVLENQPINKPNDDILLFSFIPAADRCVRGIIQFSQPINGEKEYTFGNAY